MPRALPVFALLAVLLQSPVAHPSLSAAERDAFTLGVMRRDGALIPFAAFDGRRWGNAWPPPVNDDLLMPITFAGVPRKWWAGDPPSADWQLWTPTSSIPVHVTQPDWVNAHCLRQVALKTDYRSPQRPPPPRQQPYPKDGVAVSPAHAIEPIEIAHALADVDAAELRQKFNVAELEVDRRFGHPMPRRVREAVDPAVEAVYAFGDSPRAFYVEASRMYRKLGDGGCTAIAFGTGWFVRGDGRTTWLDMAVDLLRCDKYGASYMLPLGAVRSAGRTFWIVQYSGWDHERYVVVEVKKNRVEAVVSTYGGGC